MQTQPMLRFHTVGLMAALVWLGSVETWAQRTTGTTQRNRTSGSSSRMGSSSSSGNYPNATEVGQAAAVTIDPETRRLIVLADDETAQYVHQVVTNLDRPAPQVLINVVFLEVTYRNKSDIGITGQYTGSLGEGITGNYTQGFNGLSDIASGGALGTLARTGEFDVTLKAMAEKGKLEVLSRPTILARNNQEAVIKIGQRVPLIGNVRYDNYGNQINSITYQDIGIILTVTPFVTSNDMVEMIVSPEISSLAEESTTITSNGTNSVDQPYINNRSADTVVVTPDRQTVVIGGLMQDKKTETVAKVPVLGDIPLLGAAFRRKQKDSTKTELLIFITPHIIRNPAQLASATKTSQDNAQNMRKAFSEEELNQFLDTVPNREDAVPRKTTK